MRRRGIGTAASVKRVRRGETAGRALVEAWRSSGLSAAEFARRRGVPAQRLSYWRLRLEPGRAARHSDVPTTVAFVEVPPPATRLAVAGEVVIEVGSDLRVRLSAGAPTAAIASLVQALRAGGASAPC